MWYSILEIYYPTIEHKGAGVRHVKETH